VQAVLLDESLQFVGEFGGAVARPVRWRWLTRLRRWRRLVERCLLRAQAAQQLRALDSREAVVVGIERALVVPGHRLGTERPQPLAAAFDHGRPLAPTHDVEGHGQAAANEAGADILQPAGV